MDQGWTVVREELEILLDLVNVCGKRAREKNVSGPNMLELVSVKKWKKQSSFSSFSYSLYFLTDFRSLSN